MKLKALSAALVASTMVAATAVSASTGGRYGTAEEAADLARQLIAIIDSDGVAAGMAAVADPAGPFQQTGMGVHIFDNSVIVADSRDPELETVSYSGVADLDGRDFWEEMVNAANGDNNLEVRWYDYENPDEEYTFNCHSEWQSQDVIMVWICR